MTVVCADGAVGYPEQAPYDRVIATVGVSDLAPAWLEQAAPQARIVVPLDVRGTQLSVAFERATGRRRAVDQPVARAVRVHADARLAGRARTRRDARARSVPAAARRDRRPASRARADSGALAALLSGPSVPQPTGVRAGSAQVFWGLGLWLAAHEPRSFRLNEERPR